MRHKFSKERSLSCSKPLILTVPTVSGFLWCKMKRRLDLHQILHHLSEKIRYVLRSYEIFGNLKALRCNALRGFEEKEVVVCI